MPPAAAAAAASVHTCRLAVLYLLSGLLSLMLGTMLLRYVLWFTVWLPTGAHFWLLPNMMSEEVRPGVPPVSSDVCSTLLVGKHVCYTLLDALPSLVVATVGSDVCSTLLGLLSVVQYSQCKTRQP